jgi:hypothetical protein
MVSFQEMTEAQVRAYVRWAAAQRSPALYSLNRDRSPYNAELSNVRDVIGESYEISELELLPVSYTKLGDPWSAKSTKAKTAAKAAKAAKKRAKAKRKGGVPSAAEVAPTEHLDYRHVAGVLRS